MDEHNTRRKINAPSVSSPASRFSALAAVRSATVGTALSAAGIAVLLVGVALSMPAFGQRFVAP